MRRTGAALTLVVALILTGCGRETSVRLGDGDTMPAGSTGGSGERSTTGDPDDTLGGLEPGYGEEHDSAAPEAAGEESVADSRGASAAPAKPRQTGGSGSSTSGSGTSPGSAGDGAPDQGIAPGEPHPDDPDGCPECTTSTTPAEPVDEPHDDSGDGGYTTPRPGQEDVRAREWESAQVAEDDVTVTITWWSGVEPCTVLDHVDVVEQADKVVITLYEGNAPGDEGACAAIAVQKRTRVTLSAPLAGRTIADGAKK